MDNSLAGWLRLREPADATARSSNLTDMIADELMSTDPVHVLDLATGTGANLRYLTAHLPVHQRWLVVDRNSALLAHIPALTSEWGAAQQCDVRSDPAGCIIRGKQLECHVEIRRLNLKTLCNTNIFLGRHLVTASALLDLVSEKWLAALADRCRAVGAAVLFTITYTGQSVCSPMEPEDDMICNLLNQHQKTDKGLGGPAAGPDAAQCAARCFAAVGYRVRTAPSNWRLGPSDQELQRQLIAGWAEVASHVAPGDVSHIDNWRDRRFSHIDANRSHVVVSHLDIAAWLPHDVSSQ